MLKNIYCIIAEDYLADLALEAYHTWTSLENESAERLIWMTGLLNFGDPNATGPEVNGRSDVEFVRKNKKFKMFILGNTIGTYSQFRTT